MKRPIACRRPILHLSPSAKPPPAGDETPVRPAQKPRRIIEQAARDLEGGLVDTDRGPQTNQISKTLKN